MLRLSSPLGERFSGTTRESRRTGNLQHLLGGTRHDAPQRIQGRKYLPQNGSSGIFAEGLGKTSFSDEVGDFEEAFRVYEESIEIARQLSNNNPQSGQAMQDLAFSYAGLGECEIMRRHSAEALAHFSSAEGLLAGIDGDSNHVVRSALEDARRRIAELEAGNVSGMPSK